MSVATQTEFRTAVRSRVINWPGASAILGARLYSEFPDVGAWPGTRALLTIENYGTLGWGQGLREEPHIVFTTQARGNGARAALDALGDLIEAALLEFVDSAGGAIAFGWRLISKVPLPDGGEDQDRAIKQDTLRFSAIRWKPGT